MNWKFLSTLLLAGIFAGAANAESGADESSLSLRGFGTVGLARSSSDHAEFVRDLSQPVGIKGGQWSGRIDSILGLQANWQATKDIELVGQVVSRLHYDRSHNPEVMWAFAKWEPDPRLSLRAGRIGADFMMLADSRLVGYSYLPVRPPTDFFGPLFFSHFDGADVSGTLPLGDGLIRGKLFSGATQERAAGKPLGIWDTSGSPVHGLVFDYAIGTWQFRLNMASIRFATDMNTNNLAETMQMAGNLGTPGANAAADTLHTKDTKTRFLSLGIVYEKGPLQVQAMLNRIRHETAMYQNSEAGYLLAGYRLGSLTPFVGVSRWRSHTRTGLPIIQNLSLQTLYEMFLAGSHANQRTYSLGTRWDMHSNLALKFQWDSVRASPDASFSFADVDTAWNGKTNVLSVTLDFIF